MNKIRIVTIGLAGVAALLVLGGCSKASSGAAQGGQSQGQAGQYGGQGGAGGAQAGGGGKGGAYGHRSAIIPVQAVTVHVGPLNADRTTAGVIVPVVQSQVAAQVAGFVASVPKSVGDWVRRGEVVIQLDDTQLKLTAATAAAALDNAKINLSMGQDTSNQANPKLALQVQSAQAAYDSAKKNYEAQKALFNLGGISASALDNANSSLTAAQANLEGAKTALDQNNKSGDQTIAQLKILVQQAQNAYDQAQLNLRNASIRAPFDGQISAINVQPGMSAAVNSQVFTLVSASKQISFNVPPSDAPFLTSGMPIIFSFQGKDYTVHITQAPAAPISGVLPMVASAGGLGMQYGSVGEINYRIPLAQGALVPIAALATLENQNFVYVIQGGKVESRVVTIASESGTTAAVDGIKDGEIIVVSPPPGLLTGSQVQLTMMDQPANAGSQATGQQPASQQQGVRKSGGSRTGGGGSGQGAGAPSSGSGKP